jgi:hypothetical protein
MTGNPPKQPTSAQLLLSLAFESYNLGVTTGGEAYAVPKNGPYVARMLRGTRYSLRRELADLFYTATGSPAPPEALSQALEIIQARAEKNEPAELPLRVAEHNGSIVLDLGTPDGRAVVISAAGWRVTAVSPVLFRRTRQTMSLPVPVPGTGNLDALRDLVNIRGDDFSLMVGVQVATLFPAIPHPIVLLAGATGNAKTSAAQALSSLLDPAGAQVRSAPRDARNWIIAAASSYVMALDNLSSIQPWLSDLMCQAVTGTGYADRALFTDDLIVLSYRRVIYLTSIDPGALRDDLADRLVRIWLEDIPDHRRDKDATMTAAWQAAHPKVLAGLLDLTVQVLAALPGVHLESRPRMADFAEILAAVDPVRQTQGLKRYTEIQDDLIEDILNSDPVYVALRKMITPFEGTTTELFDRITRRDKSGRPVVPRSWPDNPQAMSASVRRVEKLLRKTGWTFERLGRHGRNRDRILRIVPPPVITEAAPGPPLTAEQELDAASWWRMFEMADFSSEAE